MGDKKIETSGSITQTIIGNWLLWIIILNFLNNFIFGFIKYKIESMVLVAIISIILQGIIVVVSWKFSTSSSFKKKTIVYEDVPKVMKNLIIFTIAICIFNCIYNGFYYTDKVNTIVDETIQSDFKIKYTEKWMSYLYDDNQMKEYNTEKEKMIKKIKNEAYTYLAILEIGTTAVYLAALPLEKKEILKHIK